MRKKFKTIFGFLLAALAFSAFNGQTPLKTAAISPDYLHGWDYDFNNGAEGSVSWEGTELKIDVTNAGTADWHAKLAKYEEELPAGDYVWKIKAKASKQVKANILVGLKDQGNIGENWNRELTTSFKEFSTHFSLNETGLVSFLFQYGGNWDENKAEPYTIYVSEFTVSKLAESKIFEQTFDDGLGKFHKTNDSGTVSIEHVNNALKLEITEFGEDLEYHIRLRSGETGIPVLEGERFRVQASVDASAKKQYKLGITRRSHDWQDRAAFKASEFDAGHNDFVFDFVAEKDLDDLRLNFEMGEHDQLVDGKITLIVDDVFIYKYSVDLVVESLRFYKTVAEFAVELAGIDSCVDGEFGFGAVPRLRADFFERLIDPEAMDTTLVKDYNYTFGDSEDPKVDDAVTVSAKWAMLVNNYDAKYPGNGSGANIVENAPLNGILIVSAISGVLVLGYFVLQRKRKFN